MWIELPNLWIALVNIMGIPLCHIMISWLATCLPATIFERSATPLPSSGNLWYDTIWQVRRWKHYLPDAAPWFKGFAKGSLQSTDYHYLKTFALETRRGEFSHWIQLLVISLFIIWTPSPASFIIIFYAIISNAPCIINLRYTRLRINSLIHRKHPENHVN